MKKLTLTEAFAQFGAELTNPRWQCSAIAKDDSLVVSCWSDFLKTGDDGHKRYEYSRSQWGEGNRIGRKLIWTHLRTAFDRKLPVRLVIATLDRPEDADRITTDASPFSKTFSTDTNLVGRVVEFDDEKFAIEFRLRSSSDNRLDFARTIMRDTQCVWGAPRDWVWSKDGFGVAAPYDKRGYPKRPDFYFAVLWEIRTSTDAPTGVFRRTVFLEVDCPVYDHNATLNTVKRQLVCALMDSDLRAVMLRKGYGCDQSSLRRSDARMQHSRTTAVYKVIPGSNHNWPSPEEAIQRVHADLGESVDKTLHRFKNQLNAHFA
jgi:hypothetical protein